MDKLIQQYLEKVDHAQRLYEGARRADKRKTPTYVCEIQKIAAIISAEAREILFKIIDKTVD
jgi:hypothetical protein